MIRMKLAVVCFSVTALLFAGSVQGQFDLRITEIWPGNIPGNNLSGDWFEITNYGTSAWAGDTDGFLWYDDDSLAPGSTVQLFGVDTIAPGESVVFVEGNVAATATWRDLWDDVVSPLPQSGRHSGAGLGQGGDTVGIWISPTQPEAGTSPYYVASFPNANNNGGQSYDTVLNEFSTVGNAAGAVATIVVNTSGQPAIGSPGSVVPEPASLGLFLLGASLLAIRRKR